MKYTSVPVKPDTLKRLRDYKTGGKSFDEVLNDLMDEVPTEEFIQEHVRRMREEPRTPLEDVVKRLEREE